MTIDPRDFVIYKPSVERVFCPQCEPNADPIAEILEVRWCGVHQPERVGLDDPAVKIETVWVNEAGGEANRRWCRLVHGETR